MWQNATETLKSFGKNATYFIGKSNFYEIFLIFLIGMYLVLLIPFNISAGRNEKKIYF